MTYVDQLKNAVFHLSYTDNLSELYKLNELPNLETDWALVAENLSTTFDIQDILNEVFQQYLNHNYIFVDYVSIENKEVTILDITNFEELQFCKNKLDRIGWIISDYEYIVKELEEEEKYLQEKETKREEYLKILKTAPIEQLENFVKYVK